MVGVGGTGGGGAFGAFGGAAFAWWPGGGNGGGGTQPDAEGVVDLCVLCVVGWCVGGVGLLLWLVVVGAVGACVGASLNC